MKLAASREGEEAVGQPRAHEGGIVGGGEQITLLAVIQFHLEQLKIAGDDGEQVVETMGDAARDLADRFEALRLAQDLVLLDLAGNVAAQAR